MGKSLVIVESPAKAKTINKYLGKDFIVKSSIGHIRDLPTSGGDASSDKTAEKEEIGEDPKSSAKKKVAVKAAAGSKSAAKSIEKLSKEQRAHQSFIRRLAIDPENGWIANYVILPGKEKVLKELAELAAKSDTVYLATDLDREGEAIAWHLREAIGGDHAKYKRVTFSEITKKAISEAFERPSDINMNRVKAQQARRFLDRVVGFMLSPLLWKKVARGLSAGRVQSVAVRMVMEREHEIRSFKPEEYWQIFVDLKQKPAAAKPFTAELVKVDDHTFNASTKDEAFKSVNVLNASDYAVEERTDKPTTSKPTAPYITSTLQQAASVRLGYGVKKTMIMAQRLYEAGYITYMRTDSTHLSAEAVNACREYIGKNFGKEYLPEAANVYAAKEKAQEAHEAIRPADVAVLAAHLGEMEKDAVRLYELIWRQFVGCQMMPARFDTTSVLIKSGNCTLKARGRVMRFDGWTRVQPALIKNAEEEVVLPDLKAGEKLEKMLVKPLQKFTKPPARYSEASLVKSLEAAGIGRPSTYAAIISTIQDRGYVKVANRRFYLQKMGEIVTSRLNENFPDLMDFGFTASLEDNLDEVALGHHEWKTILDEFYHKFKSELGEADTSMRTNEPIAIDFKCSKCGRPMAIRTAKTGVFLSCTGYSLPPKERCDATVNLLPGDEVEEVAPPEGVALATDNDDEGDVEEIRNKRRCKKCDAMMDAYLVNETTKLHVCGNSPDCGGYELENGKFKIKGYDGPIIVCDKCGKDMQLKTGRFGKYFACTNTDSCKNTRKLLRNGEAAPPKEDPVHMRDIPCEKSTGYFVLRDGAAGLFMASSAFPKSRETRAPYVAELKRYQEQLSEKFKYLAEGPSEDNEGRKVLIRFKKKEKEHFLRTEEEGKPSGWEASWNGQRWVVHEAEKKAVKTAAKK